MVTTFGDADADGLAAVVGGVTLIGVAVEFGVVADVGDAATVGAWVPWC